MHFSDYDRECMRRQVISQFAGISVDMNYMLCVPSIHATCRGEEIVISFCGGIMSQSEGFPKDIADLLVRWVMLHKREIMDNHSRIGHGVRPMILIDPPEQV